jgi:hypothetical protein
MGEALTTLTEVSQPELSKRATPFQKMVGKCDPLSGFMTVTRVGFWFSMVDRED